MINIKKCKSNLIVLENNENNVKVRVRFEKDYINVDVLKNVKCIKNEEIYL